MLKETGWARALHARSNLTWICKEPLIIPSRASSRPGVAGGAGRAADPPGQEAQRHAVGRKGLYPECSPTACFPPRCPPVLGLRPRRPSADLKVPLSSRCSGGASARCLLWDMARGDSWAQLSRAVRPWVLPLHVGQFPRGEERARTAAWLPLPAQPGSLQLRDRREGGKEAGPRRGRAGHTPSTSRLSLPCSAPQCFQLPFATALGPFQVSLPFPALPCGRLLPSQVPRASQRPAPPRPRFWVMVRPLCHPGSSQSLPNAPLGLPRFPRARPRPSTSQAPPPCQPRAVPSSWVRPALVPRVSPPAFSGAEPQSFVLRGRRLPSRRESW